MGQVFPNTTLIFLHKCPNKDCLFEIIEVVDISKGYCENKSFICSNCKIKLTMTKVLLYPKDYA